MLEYIFDQHPDEEVLEKYLMAKLASSEGVEEHLLVCTACLEKAAELENIIEAVRLADSRSKIQPFRSHLPLYTLEAAAGKFGRQMQVDPEGWVEVPESHVPLTQDMFAIHIKGLSMEPDIPDGSLCAFRADVGAPYDGKIVLLEQYGELGGNRYTVKRYRSSTNVDTHAEGDSAWLHERITLESTNPEFSSWDVASTGKVNVLGEFVFALDPGASGSAIRVDTDLSAW